MIIKKEIWIKLHFWQSPNVNATQESDVKSQNDNNNIDNNDKADITNQTV